jgi:hypothetical protein
MDDIQLILYIAFVLFAIISRVLKSRKKENAKQSGQPQQQAAPERKISFEDLLKEFTQEPKEEEYQPESVPEPVERFERSYQEDEAAEKVYQESIAATKKYEQLAKETDDRHTGQFTHFKNYAEEDTEEEVSEYADLFHDHDSAKKAIILSAIINRKY